MVSCPLGMVQIVRNLRMTTSCPEGETSLEPTTSKAIPCVSYKLRFSLPNLQLLAPVYFDVDNRSTNFVAIYGSIGLRPRNLFIVLRAHTFE